MRSLIGGNAGVQRSMPFEQQKATVERLPTPSMLLSTSIIGSQHRKLKPRDPSLKQLDPPLPDWRKDKKLSPILRSRSRGGKPTSPTLRHADSPPLSPHNSGGPGRASSLRRGAGGAESPLLPHSVGALSPVRASRQSSPPLSALLEDKALDRVASRYYGAVEDDTVWEEPQRADDEDDETLVVGGLKGPPPRIGLRVEISPKAAKNRMARYGETWKNFGGGGVVSIVYPGYVWVKWDSGQGHWYNVGLNDQHELLELVPKKIKTEQEKWLEAQQVKVWRPEHVRVARGAFALRVYGSDEFGSSAMTRKSSGSLEEWWDLLQRERARSVVPGFDMAGLVPSP